MIETERLILRPFREGDAADVFEYLKAPMVNCFACMKIHSLEEAGKVIGEIQAHPEASDPDSEKVVDPDTFSPCWMLNPDYQGKGYAFEAAKAFFDYLFYQKGARRIYAYTEDYNLSSQHLCERLGMRREGLFREFVSFVNDAHGNPIYENTYQYAILKKEWDAQGGNAE